MLQNMNVTLLCNDEEYFKSIFIVRENENITQVRNLLCNMDVNVTKLFNELMTGNDDLANFVNVVST